MRKALLLVLLSAVMLMAFAQAPTFMVSSSAFAGLNIVEFDAGAQLEVGVRISDSFVLTTGVNARITKSIFTDPDAAPSPSIGPVVGIRLGKFEFGGGILSNWTISSAEPAYQNWIPFIHTGLMFPIITGSGRLKLCPSLNWYMNSAGENLEAKTFEGIWNIIVPKVDIGLTYDFR
ncbi:MAG: hypothetical protein MJ057_03690 [Sphaerochaetaceae bacterium]|nr:hypothetical protein [Sphaerochaetaceae bacterium]